MEVLRRLALMFVILGVVVQISVPSTAHAAGADYYPETGHTLSGPLRSYWEAHGGLWLFGYPISEPFAWQAETGERVVAQYFERARLEYHPSKHGTEYRVLGGLLGTDLTSARQNEANFRPHGERAEPGSDCHYFSETGHAICASIETWWNAEGGLATFGYPISESFLEDGYLVQYFERARFEQHPEFAGSQWEVELGHLGLLDAQQRGLTTSAPFAQTAATSLHTRVDTVLTAVPWGEQVATVAADAAVTLVGGPSWDTYLVDVNGQRGWVAAGDLYWSVTPAARTAARLTLRDLNGELADVVAANDPNVSVAVYDPASNRLYAGGSAGPVAGASLSKTLLMSASLWRSQQAGGEPSGWLAPMIEYSDNDAANEIWLEIGGADGVLAFLEAHGIAGFSVPHAWDWGQIAADAADWSVFLALLGSGQILDAPHTAYALGLMHSVTPQHRFGVLTESESRLSIGKNGWYLDEPAETGVFAWRINSAAMFDTLEGSAGMAPLVVVSLTRYPGEWGEEWGIDFAADVADRVAAAADQLWANGYLANAPLTPQRIAAPTTLTVKKTQQHPRTIPVERSRQD